MSVRSNFPYQELSLEDAPHLLDEVDHFAGWMLLHLDYL
jgi:hypothetical protein